MYVTVALNILSVRLMACFERGVFLWILKHFWGYRSRVMLLRTGNGYPQKYSAVFKSQSNWQVLWKINF